MNTRNMGSNLLSSSSKRSSLKIASSYKQEKSEDLAKSTVSKMDEGSNSGYESVDDIDASKDEAESSEEDTNDDNQNASSEDDSEDDGSGTDEEEEQNDNMSDSGDDGNEDGSRTMEDGDGVDFSDSDVDESEEVEEKMDLDDGECSDIRVAENPAWAEAMAKILRIQKPSGKKATALSKAKTIQAAEAAAAKKQEEEPDFEIVGEKEVKPHIKTEDVKPTAEELLQAKRERLALCRVKQEDFDYNRERALTKIATKGVVQLFNAVRAQQKDLGSKLAEAHSTRMEEKLLKSIDKNSFLEHLTGKIRSRPVEEIASPAKKEECEIVLPKSWNELSKKVESNSWDKVIEIKDEPED